MPVISKIKLKPEEYKILQDIEENPGTKAIAIANRLGLKRGVIDSLIPVLEDKQIILKNSKAETEYVLTKRGKKLNLGLPERIIIKELIKNKKIHISDIRKISSLVNEKIQVHVGILRNSGLISIDKGIISLKIGEEEALKFSLEIENSFFQIAKGEIPSLENTSELIKRGLVTKKVNKEHFFTIKLKDYDKLIEKIELYSVLSPEMIFTEKWKSYQFKPYSLDSKPRKINPGKLHPYREFQDQIKSKLVGLGFQEMKGPIIEQELWNFDALYFAQDHPARAESDVFVLQDVDPFPLPEERYISDIAKFHQDGGTSGSRGLRYKWDPSRAANLMLRTHGTALSARTLLKLNPPGKYFSIAKCYRPDAIDSTHAIEFYQVEGIICDESINFRDLLGVLKSFAIDFAGAKKAIFKPDYFNFTSPSIELGAEHPSLGSIEFGGAGIFRPELTIPLGIKHPVIAWGIGVDRLFMVKNNIADIRELFSQDLNWLRNSKSNNILESNS